MMYHGINIHPKIARELDEILAGDSQNSNEDNKNDTNYHDKRNVHKFS